MFLLVAYLLFQTPDGAYHLERTEATYQNGFMCRDDLDILVKHKEIISADCFKKEQPNI